MNKILYAKAVFGQEEKDAVMKTLESNWLAAGPVVSEFEKAIAELFGKKYAVATNSGSSANLLALASLSIPKNGEVITPACTFATTVAPIVQNNLIPIFIDTKIGEYTIDIDKIEMAINNKTWALMVPQLIGNVADMVKLRELADKYSLFIIEDSCDTLLSKIDGLPSANYSDITTTSFYGSHIITTMGTGGMLLTDDKWIYDRARSLANWGRVGSDNEDFNERFDYSLDSIPFDSKFVYETLGYNVKMTESQAAFGLEQLKRLPEFLKIRRRNFNKLYKYFLTYSRWFYLPKSLDKTEVNWLAFPLTIRDEAPFTRYKFLQHLEKNNIQTRVLFAGNYTRHPVCKEQYDNYRLPNSDKIMESGLLIGCHQGMTEEDVDYIIGVCDSMLGASA